MGKAINSKTILLIAAGIFFLAGALPLCVMIFSAFLQEGNTGVENFATIFHKDVLHSIVNSLLIAISVSSVSVMLGCCFAFLLSKTTIPFANSFRLLLLLPLLLPSYVLCVAWNDAWLFSGLPKNLIYSLPAVIFILITIYTPLAAFIIQNSLKNISASLEEAGMMITGYRKVFFKIVLPLLRPALFSSFMLIFILSLSEFAVPSFLSVPVFTTEIFTQFSAFYNYSLAITQSLLLTGICILLLLPERKYLAKESFFTFGKKSFRFKKVELSGKIIPLLLMALYILLTVLLPLILLSVQTFTNASTPFSQIINMLLPSLRDSLVIALAGAFTVTLFGLIFSYLTIRFKFNFIQTILLFVFAVPAIVTGVSLIRFYNTPSLNFIYASVLIILIAFTARFVFISVKIISGSLQQIPISFMDAAKMVGATPFNTFRKISFPLLSEALFTSFFIILIFCLNELATVIMIYPPGISLLPVTVFTRSANAPQHIVSGMSLAALLFTAGILIVMFLGKKFLFSRQWREHR